MKDLTEGSAELDYVDRLIDQVVADPTRGDDVKTLLKHKMAGPESLSVVGTVSESATINEDLEDLWDNVPV